MAVRVLLIELTALQVKPAGRSIQDTFDTSRHSRWSAHQTRAFLVLPIRF